MDIDTGTAACSTDSNGLWISYTFTAAVCFMLIYYVTSSAIAKLHIANVTSRHVFITGCDTGFGNLLARLLDAKGVHVFAGCLTEQGAEDLTSVASSRLRTVLVDITSDDSVKSAFEFVQDSLPPEIGLWGLVNNAGIMKSLSPAEFCNISDFKGTCDVNLFGTISVTLTFLPLVRKARGRLVTVCSVGSTVGFPGTSPYSVSKAAIKMFCSCLRRELYNSEVTVHTIEPGTFATNLTSGDRMKEAFKQLYTKATPDLQSYYGGNIAKFLYFSFANVDPWASAKPQLVADSMAHALLARYPKQQYIVHSGIWFFLRVLMHLPEWIVDKITGWPKPYGPKAKQLDS